MKRFICLLFLLLFVPTLAHAWNAAGHRMVAALAWEALPAETQLALAPLLWRHPDAARWDATLSDPRKAFIEASTWPDEVRSDPRFYTEGEVPTPVLPGFIDMERHKSWHYLDRHIHTHAKTGDGELDVQLLRQLALLHCRHHPQRQALALPWVIHLVGDAHQPLHVASLDDQGGKQMALFDPFTPRFPETNLHRWWDDRPGPPWLRGERLDRAVQGLLRRATESLAPGGVAVWLEESALLARETAYPPSGIAGPAIITERFREQARVVTETQLVRAGKRLARALTSALSVSRETKSCPP